MRGLSVKRSWIGLGLLAAVIALSIAYVSQRREVVEISIYYGGEKARFLKNPEIQTILRDRFGVKLKAIKAGSIEMATTLDPSRVDCIWPSNSVATELARRAGRKVLSDANIFASPIVFFAWIEVAEALEKKGVVRKNKSGFLVADVKKMSALVEKGARWREDLGVEVYGKFKIFSTDPTRSNSGNIWSALLATAFNDGDTPKIEAMAKIAPRIKAYFAAMGFMETSSGDIFENFLKQGMGSRPIIVGYENQMIEFLLENQRSADFIRDKIRIIYPGPTIFAQHPLVSLRPGCAKLAEALQDPEVQAIAWRAHGFRTGITNDPSLIKGARLPERIDLVAPMPSAAATEAILATLKP
ncbi:MAG: substrate-binding domain-containing protein [Neomegalonema sp.]|nr:substrate-binding domain-containing protein [Neomegalonema sp.]